MVDSIGSNLPPSIQAVQNARNTNAAQRSDARTQSAAPADEVTLSSEAQSLGEVNRLASETRQILTNNLDETLSPGRGSLETFL